MGKKIPAAEDEGSMWWWSGGHLQQFPVCSLQFKKIQLFFYSSNGCFEETVHIVISTKETI